MNENKAVRRIPWLGLLLVLAIALAVVAFGVFKRKGARKPPPIPEEARGSLLLPAQDRPLARPDGRVLG